MKVLQILHTSKLSAFILILILGLSGPLLIKGKAFAATGGYPWSGATCVATGKIEGRCPNFEWRYKGSVKNPTTGNYYYRNCTDYVAWKLTTLGVSVSKLSGLGNAGMWDNNAPAKGLKVSTTPSAGSVGVDERYGHVVYVEKVSGSTLTISEYNWGSAGIYGVRSGTASDLYLSKFINFGVNTSSSANKPNQTTSLQPSSVSGARFLGSDSISINQKLTANQYITSQNARYVLMMQADGNLVQYGNGFKSIWSSRTAGNSGAYAAFQGDGNLVVYSKAGKPLWSTGTRAGAKRLILQHDANLVTYSTANKPLWSTGIVITDKSSFVGSDRIKRGGQLRANQYVRSSDNRYVLMMQADGNLVAYSPGYHVIWQTGTNGNTGAKAIFQGDGNLVIYSSSGKALWSIGLHKSPAHFVMQSDGNVVAYNTSGSPFWASGTDGKL